MSAFRFYNYFGILRALNRSFHHPIEWILPAATLLMIKLWLLVNYAPEKIGEYYYFDVYSDRMLAGYKWLAHVDLYQEGSYAIELKKMIGMSLVLAGFKYFFQHLWYYPLSLLFSILSSLAAGLVFVLARYIGIKPRLAALSAFLYMLGPPIISDIVFWTDGFYGPLTVIALCLFSLARGWYVTLLASLLLALAAFSRASLFIALPAFFLGGWMISRWTYQRPWLRSFYLILPTLLLGIAYSSWNAYRTGYFVMTTDASTALLSPLFLMAAQDPSLLEGQMTVDLVMRDLWKNNRWPTSYQKAGEVSKILVHQKGLDHVQASRAVQDKFTRVLVHNYDQVFMYFIRNVKSYILYSLSFLTIPIDRMRDLYFLSESFRNKLNNFIQINSHNYDFYKIIDKISKILFTIIVGGFFFTLFVIFSLTSLRRSFSRSAASQADCVISGLTIIYFGLITPIIMVGMEPRYLSPISFIPCIVVSFAVQIFAACGKQACGDNSGPFLRDQI